MFNGGRSGGAGGGASWGAPRGTTKLADGGFDLDELWPAALVALMAGAGIVAVAYVIYIAPLLLAEVAVDAAVVTTAHRRLRRSDSRDWVGSVFRRTVLPASALILTAVIAGLLLQWIAPGAQSIGGVLRALLK